MARAGIIAALDGTHARIGRSVALGLHALIIVSAIAIAVETVPGLDPALRRALLWVEYTTLSVFAAEYLLRLTCSPRPLRYAVSFWGIVDFLAVVPAILFLLPDAQSIRSLRLLRLIRLLKLFYASRALDRLAGAFEKNRAELLIFTLIALVVLYLAAVGIHHFEHEAQPETFGSIPASLVVGTGNADHGGLWRCLSDHAGGAGLYRGGAAGRAWRHRGARRPDHQRAAGNQVKANPKKKPNPTRRPEK